MPKYNSKKNNLYGGSSNLSMFNNLNIQEQQNALQNFSRKKKK